MRLKLAAVLALQLAAVAPVLAEPAPQDFAQAFFTWAEDNGVTAPEIVVTRAGSVVLNEAEGTEPGAPRVLASLSKAVTAQCLSGLVEAGRLRWDSTLGGLLGIEGPGAGITLSQLVTHTSGLWPDRTQEAMPIWLSAGEEEPLDGDEDIGTDWRAVADWPLVPGDIAFHYSNENYALLGSVIESVTGRSYGEACSGVVPGAALAGDVGVFGAMGGLEAPLGEYAQFVALLYGNRGPEGPARGLDGGAVYGLGMFGRPLGPDWAWWHFGLLCIPGAIEAGSYSVLLRGDWGVVVAYEGCPDEQALFALDQALVGVTLND